MPVYRSQQLSPRSLTPRSAFPASDNDSSLHALYTHVASNAIDNAGGRADFIRWRPGTREAVLSHIEKWSDGNGDLSNSILWLSGPAGAGKTAIVQAIAKRRILRSAPVASFFFFRADPTRNHAGSLVATLLHQILSLYPDLMASIIASLDENPLLFDLSIREQFQHLINRPVRSVVNNPLPSQRLVLLIDGLDECSPATKHVQGDLLLVLHHLSSQRHSPFAVLVSSRSEAHLVMTFKEIGTSSDSLSLNAGFDPSSDIRKFVTAEFDRIRHSHLLRHRISEQWPPAGVIDTIVDKSSGQFIYAATVMRFITNFSLGPDHSLEILRGIPASQGALAFAELDAIYFFIFSQAANWTLVKDIIAAQFILPAVNRAVGATDYQYTIDALLCPLRISSSDIDSSIIDLAAVMRYEPSAPSLIFYHASLHDFLCDKSRSKAFYLDLGSFTERVVVACMPQISTFHDAALFCATFALVRASTPLLTGALTSWRPWRPEALHDSGEHRKMLQECAHGCLLTVKTLYYGSDPSFYKAILSKWLTWFAVLDVPLDQDALSGIPQAFKVLNDVLQSRGISNPSSIGGKMLLCNAGTHPRTSKASINTNAIRNIHATSPDDTHKTSFWKRILIFLKLRRSGA